MIDPRISVIEGRLSGVDKIIVVVSGKGGVGKSVMATAMALLMAREGSKVGLLDLDFTSPTTHVILNAKGLQPKEDKGITPPGVHGVKYMSLIFYLGDRMAPLRGAELTNILLEILAVTNWERLDALIIDMPPGVSDLMLDVLKYIRKTSFLVITTPSRMAFETVRKLLLLLRELGAHVLGVVENMKMDDSAYVRHEVKKLNERFLGEVHFDSGLEEALGNVGDLLRTRFAEEVKGILPKIKGQNT